MFLLLTTDSRVILYDMLDGVLMNWDSPTDGLRLGQESVPIETEIDAQP